MIKLTELLIDKLLNAFALLRAILGLILVSRTCLTIFICVLILICIIVSFKLALITFMLFGHFFFEFSWVNGYTNPYLEKYKDHKDVTVAIEDILEKLGVNFSIFDYFKPAIKELLRIGIALLSFLDSYQFDFYLYRNAERNVDRVREAYTEDTLQSVVLHDPSKGFIVIHYTFVAMFGLAWLVVLALYYLLGPWTTSSCLFIGILLPIPFFVWGYGHKANIKYTIDICEKKKSDMPKGVYVFYFDDDTKKYCVKLLKIQIIKTGDDNDIRIDTVFDESVDTYLALNYDDVIKIYLIHEIAQNVKNVLDILWWPGTFTLYYLCLFLIEFPITYQILQLF
jgi:hypothetical protein